MLRWFLGAFQVSTEWISPVPRVEERNAFHFFPPRNDSCILAPGKWCVRTGLRLIVTRLFFQFESENKMSQSLVELASVISASAWIYAIMLLLFGILIISLSKKEHLHSFCCVFVLALSSHPSSACSNFQSSTWKLGDAISRVSIFEIICTSTMRNIIELPDSAFSHGYTRYSWKRK